MLAPTSKAGQVNTSTTQPHNLAMCLARLYTVQSPQRLPRTRAAVHCTAGGKRALTARRARGRQQQAEQTLQVSRIVEFDLYASALSILILSYAHLRP